MKRAWLLLFFLSVLTACVPDVPDPRDVAKSPMGDTTPRKKVDTLQLGEGCEVKNNSRTDNRCIPGQRRGETLEQFKARDPEAFDRGVEQYAADLRKQTADFKRQLAEKERRERDAARRQVVERQDAGTGSTQCANPHGGPPADEGEFICLSRTMEYHGCACDSSGCELVDWGSNFTCSDPGDVRS